MSVSTVMHLYTYKTNPRRVSSRTIIGTCPTNLQNGTSLQECHYAAPNDREIIINRDHEKPWRSGGRRWRGTALPSLPGDEEPWSFLDIRLKREYTANPPRKSWLILHT